MSARPDTSDMIAIHKSLRREFALLPTLVTAVDARDTGRAQELKAHLDMELRQLHDHHGAEDAVLWPELMATGRVDPDLIFEMETQHLALATRIDVVRPIVERWARTADPAARDEVGAELSRLSDLLEAHLTVEEDRVLPLVRQHLTTADWDALRAESGRRVPKDPRVSFRLVGGLLESADDHERRTLLDQMPGPVQWWVTGIGARMYRRYTRRIRGSVSGAAA